MSSGSHADPGRSEERSARLLRAVAPETWIACGSIVFLACWLFPPGLYEGLVGEPSHLFLDLETALFTAGCIGTFYAGVHFTRRWLARQGPAVDWGAREGRLPCRTELVFGCLLVVAQIVCLLILIQRGMLSDWVAVLEEEMSYGEFYWGSASRETNPLLGIALVVTPYFIPWLFWLWLSQGRRGDLGMVLAMTVGTYLAIALPIGKRNYISRPLFGMLLVFALYVAWRGRWSTRDVAKMFGKALLVMILLFGVLQVVRTGPSSPDQMARDLSRYFVGTYNNQAMLQNGVLEFPGAGTGYYWTAWLWNFPIARDALPLAEWRADLLGPPAPYGAHERGPLLRSHGVSGTTALSTFGSSYVDLGWFGVFPFLVTGSATALAWRSFGRGRMSGVVLYPLIAYSVLDWRGNLSFPGVAFGAVVLLLLVLALGHRAEAARRARRLVSTVGDGESPGSASSR